MRTSIVRRVLAVTMGFAAVAGIAVGATNALYTDDETVPNNAIVTGVFDLTTGTPSGVFAVSGMVPGDTAYKAFVVGNGGTVQLRYDMWVANSGPADDDLSGGLSTYVYTGVTEANCAAGNVAGGTAVATDRSFGWSNGGFDLFSGRVLDGGASEVLCVSAYLPAEQSTWYSGKSTTATFTFHAVQTANNP